MVQLRPIDQAPPPGAPHFTEAEVAALQRAVIRLFALWDLSDQDASTLLGDISPRTFQRWKQGQTGRVGPDLAARLSNLVGIHKALRLLFKEKARGYAWIRKPNAAFGARSALDVMLRGQLTDLMRVRRYLDAQRSPW
ncbi:MbcA/ParS/Xre antitoxin family protein [Parvularcula oceani]|uniref:MbcA/ParS/Xre antitoxin family protein n=1 Tax=Parvularcula oceani TaxID=1247963 RepID=UPI0004E2255E|nr:MbcA/ParS/Xre antitoxin family protein [Parvularcula oceani]